MFNSLAAVELRAGEVDKHQQQQKQAEEEVLPILDLSEIFMPASSTKAAAIPIRSPQQPETRSPSFGPRTGEPNHAGFDWSTWLPAAMRTAPQHAQASSDGFSGHGTTDESAPSPTRQHEAQFTSPPLPVSPEHASRTADGVEAPMSHQKLARSTSETSR